MTKQSVVVRLEDQLHKQYGFLVPEVVSEFPVKAPQYKEELISAGNLGLSQAIAKTLGSLTREGAAQSIRNAIKDHLGANAPAFSNEFISLETPSFHTDPEGQTLGDTLIDKNPTPDAVALLNECLGNMEQVVGRFPEPSRTILRYRLFYAYNGLDCPMSFREIGEQVNMTEKQVERKYKAVFEFISRVKVAGMKMRIPRGV